jgi:hypothetical protein
MSDDGVVHAESMAHTDAGRTNSAPFRRRNGRWLAPPDRLAPIALRTVWIWLPPRSHQVHHVQRWEVNHDQSRFCAASDTGVLARRAAAARAGRLGSGDQPRAVTGVELLAHNCLCNSADRDHNGCRCRPLRGKQRRESGG